MACLSLEDLLPRGAIKRLAFEAFGREATPQELSDLLHPLPSPPGGLERVSGAGGCRSLPSPFVAGEDWPSASLSGFESLSGYFARPLGLPVSYALSQSSRWEAGGWDGCDVPVVSIAFLMMVRCSPRPGSSRPFECNAALLGHYRFDGSLRNHKPGEPLRAGGGGSLLVGVATSREDLASLAREMDTDGSIACGSLVRDGFLTPDDLSDLLNPAYCEREALERQAPHAPRAVKRGM